MNKKKITFEEAKELFYTDEKIQSHFDYWKIEEALTTASVFIDNVEDLLNVK